MRRLILGVAVGAGLLFAHVPPAQADDGDGWTSDGHERCTEVAAAALAKIAQEG